MTAYGAWRFNGTYPSSRQKNDTQCVVGRLKRASTNRSRRDSSHIGALRSVQSSTEIQWLPQISFSCHSELVFSIRRLFVSIPPTCYLRYSDVLLDLNQDVCFKVDSLSIKNGNLREAGFKDDYDNSFFSLRQELSFYISRHLPSSLGSRLMLLALSLSSIKAFSLVFKILKHH